MDKKKFCDWVVKEFDRYEKFHAERYAKCEIYYDLWRGKLPKKPLEHLNNVHVPMMIEAEQTITPRVFTALFPTDAPIDCQVEGDTPPEAGVVVKNLIQHYMRVSNTQGAFWSALTQNTIFGTAYLEAGSWLVRRGWTISEQGERIYSIIESRPDCKHVDFFEMFPHPAKLKMEDGLPLMRRRWCDAEYLKSLEENPFFKFDNLKAALDSKPEIKGPINYDQKQRDEYEIIDYWGPYDEEYEKDGKVMSRKAVPHWGIIINRKVCVRVMANPYNHQSPPFIKIKLYEDSKPSWFGVGIGQIGHPSQERLNKLVNNRLDNVDLILNKMGFYNANDTLLNKKQLQISKPGKWIGCADTTTSVRWMDTPDVTQEAYKEEELAKQDFRESTGATSAMMPSDDQNEQHRTAMGIQLLQGAAGMRLRPVLRNIEIDGIQALAMLFFSNARQFMTIPEWVMITGEDGKKYNVRVTPQQIQAKVFFIPTGISETVNKETQIGQLMRFKELTVNDPNIDRAELNKRIGQLMGFKDLDKLIIVAQPTVAGPGQMPPEQQLRIQQRLREGATPEQIKQELMGNAPVEKMAGPTAPQQASGGQGGPSQGQSQTRQAPVSVTK